MKREFKAGDIIRIEGGFTKGSGSGYLFLNARAAVVVTSRPEFKQLEVRLIDGWAEVGTTGWISPRQVTHRRKSNVI